MQGSMQSRGWITPHRWTNSAGRWAPAATSRTWSYPDTAERGGSSREYRSGCATGSVVFNPPSNPKGRMLHTRIPPAKTTTFLHRGAEWYWRQPLGCIMRTPASHISSYSLRKIAYAVRSGWSEWLDKWMPIRQTPYLYDSLFAWSYSTIGIWTRLNLWWRRG